MFFRILLFCFCGYTLLNALSIERLISSTLETHPTLKASQQIIKSAESGVEGARWGYYPTPSVEISQSASRRGASLRLDQPLWTGGKIDASVDIAVLAQRESLYGFDESSYLLVESLLQSVQSYHQATLSIQALEEGKFQLNELQAMLERRIEAGVSSQADRELLSSRISQIEGDLASSRTKALMARHQIELISGVRIDGAIEVNTSIVQNKSLSYPELAEAVSRTHPSLKKLAVRTQIAHAELDKAKAVLWPSLMLRAEHTNGSIYTDGGKTDNLVYLYAQMSTGAGLSALSSIQSAESKILQSQFEQQSKTRELIDNALREYNNFQTYKDRITSITQTIAAAQKVFDSYTRLFIAGKRQWLDLVNSSRELTQYKTSQAEIKASYALSAYQLALKQGTLNVGEHP